MIRASGARPLDARSGSPIHAMLGQLSRRAAIPPPLLYVAPSPQPNAFAIGRSPRHAAIVVTEGLLSLLESTEVQAVLAHELTHIRRRDTLVTSMAGRRRAGCSRSLNWRNSRHEGIGEGRQRGLAHSRSLPSAWRPACFGSPSRAVARAKPTEPDQT